MQLISVVLYLMRLKTREFTLTMKYMFFLFLSILPTQLAAAHNNLTICFHINEMNERGTPIAIYDYADYNEKILGHKSIFVVPNTPLITGGVTRARFENRFGPFRFYNPQFAFAMTRRAKMSNCDVLFLEKAGGFEDQPSFTRQFGCNGPPISVHGFFFWQKHGTAYGVIHPDLVRLQAFRYKSRDEINRMATQFVPLIVRPPNRITFTEKELLRTQLNVPKHHVTFCRHGGYTTFDVPSVHEAICRSAIKHSTKASFMFLNTPQWNCSKLIPGFPARKLDNVHFLPTIVSEREKENYFSSCNVMIHARPGGEVFSIALAEASSRNIPIIFSQDLKTPKQPIYTEGKALLYENNEQLLRSIDKIAINGPPKGDFNAYRNFTPEIVMKRFDELFIQEPLRRRASQRTINNRGNLECVWEHNRAQSILVKHKIRSTIINANKVPVVIGRLNLTQVTHIDRQ